MKKIPVTINRWNLADDYNRHAAAAMVSMMENSSKPIEFHLLHEEDASTHHLNDARENIQKYQELVSKYNSDIYFHNISLSDELKEMSNNSIGKWSPSVFFSDIFRTDSSRSR